MGPNRPRASLLSLVVALLLCGGASAAVPVPAPVQSQARSRGAARVIVVLNAPAAPGARVAAPAKRSAARSAILRARNQVLAGLPASSGRRLRVFRDLPVMAMDASETDLAALSLSPDVVAIEPDRILYPSVTASLALIGADVTASAGFRGHGVAVAVLDTGLDASHPDFAGKTITEACFSSNGGCPNGQTSQAGPGSAVPCSLSSDCWHGTHVSGIAVGDATPGGVAPGADLVAVRIFSIATGSACNGTGEDPCAIAYTSDLISGLDYVDQLAASMKIAAVNMSLGGGKWTSASACDQQNLATKAAVDRLRADGVATVAAAGNDGYTNGLAAPACISSVVSVGATSASDTVPSWSDSASMLSLMAPGVSIESAVPGGGWGIASGTSMATPHVSGAFASMRSGAPGATVDQMISALTLTGIPVTDSKSGITRPRIEVDSAMKTFAPGPCFNGVDDDGDGKIDYPADPGCLTGFSIENPACNDGIDNDNDGRIDYNGGPGGEPPDPQCTAATGTSESPSCGLGFELVGVLPPFLWARRRRKRRRPRPAA